MILTKAIGSIAASCRGPGGGAFSKDRAMDTMAFDVYVSSVMSVPLAEDRRTPERQSEKQDS
jgi:hypothetical protein